MPYVKYKDVELKEILSNVIIQCDTREQKNKHITDYFNTIGLKYEHIKLDSGDYSVLLPAQKEQGIFRDLHFDNSLVIERKNNLDELANNLTKDRERFRREFQRLPNIKKILLIESNSYDDLVNGQYRSKMTAKAFNSSIMSLSHEFNINTVFVSKEKAGFYIASYLHYGVRNYLLNR